MKYLQEPILTAIIPIGDYERHHENINAIIHSCEELPIKLVLVLDNQTDTSFESLRDLLHSTHNLTWDLLRVDAKSPGLARNEGLRELKTKWVTFWDSDDIPSPNETLRAISECHSATQMIIGNFKVINDKGEFEPCPQLSPSHNELNYKSVSKMPGLWRMIFRSSTVEQIIFPGLRMGEDQVFLSMIDFSTIKILTSAEVVYEYTSINPSSLTNNRAAVSELGETMIILSDLVCSRKTNTLGIHFLIRMLGTIIVFAVRRHLHISPESGILIARKTLEGVFKSVMYRNPNRLRIIN
jgi:glycosyltransferase involved in cell wall biosynthesis